MLEQKQGLELDSEFPHHLGELSPLQTRSSLGPEAVFPCQIGSSLAAEAASSIRLGVPWGQRMCLANQPGSSLGAGLCLSPNRSGVI